MPRFGGIGLVSSPRLRRAGWSPAGRAGATLLTLCLTLCPMGQTAWAEGDRESAEPRWIPSINLGFDAFEYNADSAVENHINPPANDGKQSSSIDQFNFQLGAELMGPIFEGLPAGRGSSSRGERATTHSRATRSSGSATWERRRARSSLFKTDSPTFVGGDAQPTPT